MEQFDAVVGEVRDIDSMQGACRELVRLGAKNVVIKGGHLLHPIDLLGERHSDGTITFRSYPGERINTKNTHGTGCTFSTALACNLTLGKSLGDAVFAAKNYVTGALRTSRAVGKGVGPINHLFSLK